MGSFEYEVEILTTSTKSRKPKRRHVILRSITFLSRDEGFNYAKSRVYTSWHAKSRVTQKFETGRFGLVTRWNAISRRQFTKYHVESCVVSWNEAKPSEVTRSYSVTL